MTPSSGLDEQDVVLNPVLTFFQDRLKKSCTLIDPDRLTPDIGLSISQQHNAEITLEVLTRLLEQTGEGAHALQLDDNRSIVAASLVGIDSSGGNVATVLDVCAAAAVQLVDSVLEAYRLSEENQACRAALEESAMQLAQSFEEQNWLRGFARNATGFTNKSSANDMANGVLQPLGYLLRAHDVYMLVDSEETARSGLCSAKFGDSDFSTATIEKVLAQFDVHLGSPPLVRNNIEVSTENGIIRSIVAVSVNGQGGKGLGFLVGINRSTETHQDGLPVYDPEFGSGDVGLLEEAAVLLATQAHNIQLLVQSNQLFLGSLHAMSSAIDARDPYTQGHSKRVARLGFELARIMKLSEPACQEIYLSGILHDIGKIGIPDSVLLKDGPLTDDEFRTIQQHPEIGYRIVERLGHLQFVLPGVLHHHERFDGKGYPHGLAGESIPLMARILAVADAFDAMTSSRPYRDAMPLERAVGIISGGCDEQWDKNVVEAFLEWINAFNPQKTVSESGSKAFIPEGSPIEQVVQAVMTLGL
ncbi:MAG: hypothetical protein Aurels2KO_13850 [Aureliella sp.]